MKPFLDTIDFVDGRYEISLPFKEDHETIPDNYSLSLQRCQSLIKRLRSKPEIMAEYNSVIDNQAKQGIIEWVPESELNNPQPGSVHYLPHYEVVCSDKSITRVRIVYDGSSKRKNEVSLNETFIGALH